MAASTREVFLLLKARDEASRVLRGFGAEVARSQNAIRAAAMRAQATAMQGEVHARRQASALVSQQIAERQLAAAENDRNIRALRQRGISQQQLTAMRDRSQALRDEARDMQINQRAYDRQTAALVAHVRQLDRESSELERADRQMRSFHSAVNSAGMGLGTFAVGMIAVGATMGGFFYEAFQGWQEYQRQVALTRTQVDGFEASMQDLSDMGIRIANEVPVAFAEIQPALFDIFSSTSANLKQSEILLEGFSKAAVAGQTEVQVAARGTMAIMNAYNVPFEKVNEILDIQFELVRKGVGTYAEFAKIFGRVVPSATRAGQSFATVAAMLAYMTRNGQSAAMASTAAARALDAFSHPKSIKNLERLGVKMRDAKGHLLPLVDVLEQFRQKLLKMPTKSRVGAILDVFKGSGGTIQARRFIEQVLLRPGELEDFKKMLGSMENASGVMGEKYAEMADTAAAKTQLLDNRWQTLKVTLGEAAAPAILKIVDFLSKMLDKFNKLDPETKKMITNFALITVGVLILGGALLGIIAIFVLVAGAVALVSFEMLIAIGIIAAIVLAVVGIGASFAAAWKKSEPLRNFFKGFKEDLIEFRDKVIPIIDEIKKAWDEKIIPPLQRLAKVIDEEVIPKLDEFRQEVWDRVMPKVIEAFRLIKDGVIWALGLIQIFIDEVVIPTLKNLADWWDKNKDEMGPLIDAFAQLLKWALILSAVLLGIMLVALIILLAPFAMLAAAIIGAIMAIVEFKKQVELTWEKIKKIAEALDTAKKAVEDWFKNTSMTDAAKSFGENIVTSLINGIKSKLGALGVVMNSVASVISDFMQHSPAKKGPLSGRGYTFYSGQSVAGALAAGMVSQLGTVQAASNQLAMASSMNGAATFSGMSSTPVGGFGSPIAASTNTNARGPINITVHTNEIDPRTQAAELGWELDGRLG